MKRILSILLAVVMAFGVLPLAASAGKSKIISFISIYNIDVPIIGEHPDFDVTVDDAEEDGITYWVSWSELESGVNLTENDKFKKDKQYSCSIWMSTEQKKFNFEGVDFYDPKPIKFVGTVKINGKEKNIANSFDMKEENYKGDKCIVGNYARSLDDKEEINKTCVVMWFCGKAQKGTYYTVSFETNGFGDDIKSEKVLSGKTIQKPKYQFDRGKVFEGWYSDPDFKTEYKFDTPVKKDITLYAKWSETNPSSSEEPEPIEKTEPVISDYVCPFVDVAENEWYFPWVSGAHKMGLINGKDDTHYKPDDLMTYAEAIKLAACMNQLKYNGEITITNGEEHWYDTYVAYCLNSGIISEDYSAVINESIDRQTYALIFSKALPADALEVKNDIPDGSIPDVQNDNPNYDAIYTLYRAGIINGSNSYGAFNPINFIKRSEVAAILNRMMDVSVRVGAPAELLR